MEHDTSAKIRIRIGGVEIDCEGTEAFLKDELPALVAEVSSLYEKIGQPPEAQARKTPVDPSGTPPPSVEGAVATLAQKLKVKSGSDLILAASARLTFGLGKASFTRDEISDQMKAATGYYKKTYMNNLSSYLSSLVKSGDLIQPSDSAYSLSLAKRQSLEALLA